MAFQSRPAHPQARQREHRFQPEVRTTLSGKIANIEKGRFEQLMHEHQDHSLTVTLLKGLLLAKRVSDHLDGKLESVTLHITLGIPPGVNVELH